MGSAAVSLCALVMFEKEKSMLKFVLAEKLALTSTKKMVDIVKTPLKQSRRREAQKKKKELPPFLNCISLCCANSRKEGVKLVSFFSLFFFF